MDRKTGVTFNRKVLLTCDSAVCVNCEKVFAPAEVIDWTDLNESNIGQTAICPHCQADGIIGFNDELDDKWLFNFRKHRNS
ncbi:MAG: hypothetical protein KA365_01705 [Arenimonas sp.]|nr:hypothetical protein [Arenimonas sp.]MBP6309243.1 hypothetical protein [Arenimonas sp.]